MYLFFDTETTGLPRNWKAPVTQLNNWPRMVQIAWLIYDKNGTKISSKDYIIKPENFSIPYQAEKIHRISTERAMKEGQELDYVLKLFAEQIDDADFLIAHNISFDKMIVGAEFIRKIIANNLFKKKLICTMEKSVNFCQLPGNYGYKWPKLSELYFKLFGENFKEAHNAAVDIDATAKCFWELKKRDIIKLDKF